MPRVVSFERADIVNKYQHATRDPRSRHAAAGSPATRAHRPRAAPARARSAWPRLRSASSSSIPMTAPASIRFPCRAELAAKRQASSWKRGGASRRFGRRSGCLRGQQAGCVLRRARLGRGPAEKLPTHSAADARRAYPPGSCCGAVTACGNEPVLLHAAAGGVGLVALRWARHWSESDCGRWQRRKAALVREHGAAEVIVSTRDSRGITRKGSSRRIRRRRQGHIHSFAQLPCRARAHGELRQCIRSRITTISPLELTHRGSLFLTRPTLFHYTAKASELARRTRLSTWSGAGR